MLFAICYSLFIDYPKTRCGLIGPKHKGPYWRKEQVSRGFQKGMGFIPWRSFVVKYGNYIVARRQVGDAELEDFVFDPDQLFGGDLSPLRICPQEL